MECLDLIYKFVFRGEEVGRKVGMEVLGVHREVGTSLRSAPIFVIYKAGFKPTPYLVIGLYELLGNPTT